VVAEVGEPATAVAEVGEPATAVAAGGELAAAVAAGGRKQRRPIDLAWREQNTERHRPGRKRKQAKKK
jgi:hypothetical protein